MMQVSLLMLTLTVAQTPDASTADVARRRAARRTPIVDVVENAGPSVVNISTRVGIRKNPFSRNRTFGDFFGRYFGRREQEESLGSGVIIDAEGLVLTNEHVVAQATDITVTLSDRRSLAADVIGADADFDVAVLKIRDVPDDLPVARIGTSTDLMIGETVVAIGNPF
ncbi:MAG: trypsin-like peptidase domain-containing protein, partial [Myxococcota bacterium]